jgi:hypothetical protein
MRGTAPSIKAWGGLSGRQHVDATGLLMILAMARRASLGHGGQVMRENSVTVFCVWMCYCSGDPARLRAALA